jgi:hypothetical protein
MKRTWNYLTLSIAAGALALMLAAPASASIDCSNPENGCGPTVNATPELDSVVLMGGGLVSMASYAALRLRARRKKD